MEIATNGNLIDRENSFFSIDEQNRLPMNEIRRSIDRIDDPRWIVVEDGLHAGRRRFFADESEGERSAFVERVVFLLVRRKFLLQLFDQNLFDALIKLRDQIRSTRFRLDALCDRESFVHHLPRKRSDGEA